MMHGSGRYWTSPGGLQLSRSRGAMISSTWLAPSNRSDLDAMSKAIEEGCEKVHRMLNPSSAEEGS